MYFYSRLPKHQDCANTNGHIEQKNKQEKFRDFVFVGIEKLEHGQQQAQCDRNQ